MQICVTNLHKDAAFLMQQFTRQQKPVAQVGEIRMNA